MPFAKCYKPSTMTCRLQEVLMPIALKPSQRSIQLALFHPTRNEPSWEAVPTELQQQVLRLLARMLRDHLSRRHGELAMSEDRDE
jgi:hypothetical protein